MYESITYQELKRLPREQKPNAWKELKSMYATQKELAGKLGVSPAIVYNMISRYAKDENEGNKREIKFKSVKTMKKTRNRTKKQEIPDNRKQEDAIMEIKPVFHEIPEIAEIYEDAGQTFSIYIKKILSGEDAQFLLNGIGSTLLKNQKYAVEVKITEK